MQSKLLLLITLAFSSITAAIAATPIVASDPSSMTLYCPKISDLKKSPTKLTWSAERNSFRSYDISFATKIDKFVGAQWVGSNVGQITCIYKAFPKTSFPILLVFHTLTLTPTKGAWSKNLGGYKNCNSLNQKDCPFVVRLRHKQTNIYQEAEGLKSSTPQLPAE